MARKTVTLEEHFLVALSSRAPRRSLEGILDCLDEDAYRAVSTVAEALRGGDDPEAINSLILAAGRLLRQAAERMPDWAEDAKLAVLHAAESADESGCELVSALVLQAWRETSRLLLCGDEDA
ncbi:MAG TPA: hypothetical protein VFJ58_08125 [Armatimonadota bacterium]|nr:hypothetical protein [Armatimonadota bacterium]